MLIVCIFFFFTLFELEKPIYDHLNNESNDFEESTSNFSRIMKDFKTIVSAIMKNLFSFL